MENVVDWAQPIVVIRDGVAHRARADTEDRLGSCLRVHVDSDYQGPWWAEAETGEIEPSIGRVRNVVREFKAGDYVVNAKLDNGVYQVQSDGGNFSSPKYRPATPAEIAEYLAEHALEAQYKGEPLPLAVPTVTLPMMTEEEAARKSHFYAQRYYDDEFQMVPELAMGILRELGLIAPTPTDLERYKAETGAAIGGIEDAIEAAIKWARENS